MKLRAVLFLLLGLVAGCGSQAVLAPATAQTAGASQILVLASQPSEIDLWRAALESPRTVNLQGRQFTVGTFAGRSVAAGIAGIGLVNSGAGTALAIEEFQPRAVLFNGTAGGLGVATGDVVLGERCIQYSFAFQNATAYQPWPTFPNDQPPPPAQLVRNPLYFAADPALLAAGERAASTVSLPPLTFAGQTRQPGVVKAGINTGDVFSVDLQANLAEAQQTGCQLFEQEGGAVAQICYQLNIPCLIVRSVSNPADESGFAIYEELGDVAADNAQRVTMEIVRQL